MSDTTRGLLMMMRNVLMAIAVCMLIIAQWPFQKIAGATEVWIDTLMESDDPEGVPMWWLPIRTAIVNVYLPAVLFLILFAPCQIIATGLDWPINRMTMVAERQRAEMVRGNR